MARPIDPDARRHPVACRLTEAAREWLATWRPTGTAADQLSDVLEWAMLFRPQGGTGGRPRDPEKAPRTRLTSKAARYATAHGMTREEALNLAWAAFEEKETKK